MKLRFLQRWKPMPARWKSLLRRWKVVLKRRKPFRQWRKQLPQWRNLLPKRQAATGTGTPWRSSALVRALARIGRPLKRPFYRVGIGLFDRGAVLSIGIIVGVVLAVSFWTEGKPFAGLIWPGGGQKGVAPVLTASVPTPVASRCTDGNFPFSQRVLSGLRANRALRIGVFGDSFGDGIGAATQQFFRGDRSFEVYPFSKEATGFTRYKSLDLLEDTKAKVAQQPIDIALFDFGANDTQGIWADGKAVPYMSAAWQQQIGERAGAIVRYLQNQGVAVGWIGLPRMRKDSFDADIQAMNAFYAGLACKLHIPFVNPVAVSEDSGHHFAKELIDPESGQSYLARADDGIHMSFHGYLVLARPLLQRIAPLSAKVSAKASTENDPSGKES